MNDAQAVGVRPLNGGVCSNSSAMDRMSVSPQNSYFETYSLL